MSAATDIPPQELAVLTPIPVADGAEFRSRMGSISRQSFVYFAGTIFTAAAGYFFKIYLARTLGAEALGLYALGITIIGFVGLFNSLGLPMAAARFVAAYCARGEYSQLGSFLRGSLGLLTALNVLLVGMVLLVGPWLAEHFYHAPQLSRYLWAFAAIMLLGVLNMFLGQVMAGYRDIARRTLITHFTGTPANIAIAVLLISLGFGLSGYMVAQVASALLVLCLLCASVWKMSPAESRSALGLHINREVVAFSAVAYGIAALQFLLAQSDKVVLGYYLDAKHVGIYAVAMALVGFVPIALESVNQIFSPIISELHAAENHAVLQQLYATLTKWVIALTIPLALTMIIHARRLMLIFGPAFEPGTTVVMIGAAGQVLNCAVGSVGFLLLMSGNQAQLMKIEAVSAALMIGLNIFLVPRLGIAGAAIAAIISMLTTNIWALASVRRILKIFPYNSGYLKLIWPSAFAAAGTLVLARVMSGIHAHWKVAGAGLLFAYMIFIGMIFFSGLEQDDLDLAKVAWARVGQNFRKTVFI
ncbi:MAG TPA: flippase [Terriglobales bacterium]|nr:flippase [Terriglobales bacterium]